MHVAALQQPFYRHVTLIYSYSSRHDTVDMEGRGQHAMGSKGTRDVNERSDEASSREELGVLCDGARASSFTAS